MSDCHLRWVVNDVWVSNAVSLEAVDQLLGGSTEETSLLWEKGLSNLITKVTSPCEGGSFG